MQFSYSRISLYQRCPFKYKKVYLDGCREKPGPAVLLGSALHAALEEFYTPSLLYALHMRRPSVSYLLDCYQRHWTDRGFQRREAAEKYRSQGEDILRSYHSAYVANGNFAPGWRLEQYFEIACGLHSLRGFIDRIDKTPKGFEIIDYKSDSRLRSQEEIDVDLQLAIYFLGCVRSLNIIPVRVSMCFLRFCQTVSTSRYTVSDADMLEQHLAELVTTIAAAKEFPATANRYCRFCEFNLECDVKLPEY